MSATRIYETRIRDIIKNNHDEKSYNDYELQKAINDIATEVKKDHIVDHDVVINSISQFIYCAGTKYFFNFKRKQTKKREYIDKILNPDKGIFLQVDINDFNKEYAVEFNDYQSPEELKPNETNEYVYPPKEKFNCIKHTTEEFGPYGTQWIHDEQVDDIVDSKVETFSKQFDVLRAIILPEQKSDEWHKMRFNKITASDGGTVIDVNHHEQQFKFILKKTLNPPFEANEFCHHGIKYEDVATSIYEYRMNITTEEFGLIGHPLYDFLGASPDRICNRYKLDGIHKTKFVGRMLEIKCPYIRKIKMSGEIIDEICPIYYWVQTQLQLECCDLEECDFWQCEIKEYESRHEFNNDTDKNEPFRSKTTGFEKGCIIQLLPKDKMKDIIEGNYNDIVYGHSKYIYAPKIEMSPHDCDIWIAETLDNMQRESKYNKYFFDKVIYWKLITSKNVLINRDRKWFADNLPTYSRMWNYVLFLRANKDKLQLLADYIESRERKINKTIMSVIDKICNVTDPQYEKNIEAIKNDIVNANKGKVIKPIAIDIESVNNQHLMAAIANSLNPNVNDHVIIDDSVQMSKPTMPKKSPYIPHKRTFGNNFVTKTDDNDDYMFI